MDESRAEITSTPEVKLPALFAEINDTSNMAQMYNKKVSFLENVYAVVKSQLDVQDKKDFNATTFVQSFSEILSYKEVFDYVNELQEDETQSFNPHSPNVLTIFQMYADRFNKEGKTPPEEGSFTVNKDNANDILSAIETHLQETYISHFNGQLPQQGEPVIPKPGELEIMQSRLDHFIHEYGNIFNNILGYKDLIDMDEKGSDTYNTDLQSFKDYTENLVTLFERYGDIVNVPVTELNTELFKAIQSHAYIGKEPPVGVQQSKIHATVEQQNIDPELEDMVVKSSDAQCIELVSNMIQNAKRNYQDTERKMHERQKTEEILSAEKVSQRERLWNLIKKPQSTKPELPPEPIKKEMDVETGIVKRKDGTFYSISFRDYGTGFPDSMKDDKGNFRFKNKESHHGGQGLGGYFLQQQIEQHGGHMILENVRDKQGNVEGAQITVLYKLFNPPESGDDST